jgi:hypothetical protein
METHMKRTNLRTVTVALLAILATLGLAIGTSGAAQAAPSASTSNGTSLAAAQLPTNTSATTSAIQPDTKSQCPGHSLCLWQNASYNPNGGGFWFWTFGQVAADRFHYVGDNANDKASALFNNRVWAAGIAGDFPATHNLNRVGCLLGLASYPNLANNIWNDGSSVNDSISSYELASNPNDCTLVD